MRLPPIPLLPVVLVALGLASSAVASSGDRHPSYTGCHSGCLATCDPAAIPPLRRLLAWDCPAECSYACGHQLTDASDTGTEARHHQFHGKWAFTRVAGMQEPASVLFSLGNLAVHVYGWKLVARTVPRRNALRRWLLAAAAIHVNTWFWSAVFHTRDLPWTERADYFSATVTIGATLAYAVVRIFHLQTPRTRSPLCYPVTATILLLVLGHFAYVSSLPRFPYGYHVAFAACLGLVGNLLWVLWSVSFYWRPRLGACWVWPAPYPRAGLGPEWTPAVLVVLTTAAMSLELLDFPPALRRSVDAHALWHAATIPLGAAWWPFLVRDAGKLDMLPLRS